MPAEVPQITTRAALSGDVPEMCALLNAIIDIGGTTALETPPSEAEFATYFLQGGDHLACFVAVDRSGAIAGFQALECHPDIPDDWGDIATFARVQPKIAGVGAALFATTLGFARQARLAGINATIRADNTGGLRYYDKMGFQTYAVKEGQPLADGTPVDRISKRFDIAGGR